MTPGQVVTNGYAAYQLISISGELARVRRLRVKTDPLGACMGEWDMSVADLSPGLPPSRKKNFQ